MKDLLNTNKKQAKKKEIKSPSSYQAPTIIHEGVVSTRAGSPLIAPNGNITDDLFTE